MDEFNGKTVDIDLERAKRTTKKVVPAVVIVLILVALVMNSIYMIDEKEQGIILRFGTVSTVETNPGLHLKIPFAETVEKVDVNKVYNMNYGFRLLSEGSGYAEPTYDENNMDAIEEASIIVDAANNNASIALMELIIQYRVTNPVDYMYKVEDLEGTLRLALEDVVRSTVQSYTLDQAKTEKELIDQDIKPKLQKKMNDYEAGIEIYLVGTQQVAFLPNVEQAYQQKENANQYKNAKQEDAERYYNTVIPQANAEAKQLVEEASAYKAGVVAEANASVANFNALFEEYQNYPNILLEQYYIEAMNTFITNNNVVLDLTGDGDIYKFYNFDENEVVKESITQDANSQSGTTPDPAETQE